MPDLVPVVLLAVLLVIAVRCLIAGLHTGRRSTAPAVEPYRDPRPLVACHRPVCGHMSWPHDETDEGLRCTNCGLINTDAA
ncbi:MULTISPECIES: hypothetical protein [unclassified Streptomyces]|uniref:hypothetical protein n=1 Tax=unclassified Streptomyces TaxID=2593676 RepID=UPI000B5064A2|nr:MULTISPECIES: hypothetical protein [unclassified Streptomyces]MYW99913.1 hypothetical protein [Streptomyces sp. SID8378]SNB89879.1 hypothetical protein SAMN02745831_06173 [Streptomyces sp. PgraA7]